MTDDLEQKAESLERSGEFRVLRRLLPRGAYHEPDGTPVERAVYLDLETTGLNPAVDEIVEFAMVPFDFSADGRIFAVHEPFDRLREPGRPIPPAVTSLTGIDETTVAGRSIDPAEIEAFLGPVKLVVAHNAAFDRAFAERFCSRFANLPWAVLGARFRGPRRDTRAGRGWASFWPRQGYSTTDTGRPTTAARASNCSRGHSPRSGRTGLDVLLSSARATRWRIRAVGAPFEMREVLKKRGYRWDPGGGRRTKGWFTDVAESGLDAERDFLQREIYGQHEARIEVRRIEAIDRYSDRC